MPSERQVGQAPGQATRGLARHPGFGLALGLLLALAVYLSLPRAGPLEASGLEQPGRAVAAVGVLMAVLWLTEALPVPVTALLPLLLFPLLTGGALSIGEVAAPYAHELIFLYLGGFLLALAMQRWGLHRRLALSTVLLIGGRPRRVVLGFMLASAGLSMWISNTATAVMMLPIALSVVDLVRRLEGREPRESGGESFAFAICLLLGVAYGASIGGTATLIGTPPNLLLAAFVEDSYDLDLTMRSWLPLGLTLAVVFLPLAWLLLTRVVYPLGREEIRGGRELIRRQLEELGPPSRQERVVLAVFVGTAALWVLREPLAGLTLGEGVRPLAGLSDTGIALLAALVLFAWPVDARRGVFLLNWEQALELPWGILILFGGGLSLASGVRSTGVDRFLGASIVVLDGLPPLLLVALVTALVLLLTEMTSNTATVATFLPIVAASAEALGIEPLRMLVPMTLAASCAFMMPVATPPNAIVFGSGELTILQMCRAGIWLNLAALLLILTLTYGLGDLLLP